VLFSGLKLEAMLTRSRIRIALASLACLLLFSQRAQPVGEQPLGRILYTHATSLRGVTVPKSETILSGDVVVTAGDGSALVEFKSGARLKITENSSVRFLGEGDKVQAELLAGAVVSESAASPRWWCPLRSSNLRLRRRGPVATRWHCLRSGKPSLAP
jgi:hypothetical protein